MMYKEFEGGKTQFLSQGGSHLVAFHAGDLHFRRRQARREHQGIQHGQRGTLLREYLLAQVGTPGGIESVKAYVLEMVGLCSVYEEEENIQAVEQVLADKLDLENMSLQALEETVDYFQNQVACLDNVMERYFMVQLKAGHYQESV